MCAIYHEQTSELYVVKLGNWVMKSITLFIGALIFAASPMLYSNTATAPLIPVEDFAKHAAYQQVKISPDGKHLAFSFRDETEVKLAVLNRKKNEVTAIFEFGEWRQVTGFHWANNERLLLEVEKRVGYLDKKAGPRELFSANVDGKHRKKLFTVQRSNYRIVSLKKNDPKNIIILKGHGDDYNPTKEYMGVTAVELNVYTGKYSRISGQPIEDVSTILFDKDDEMRVAVRYEPDKEEFGFGTYHIYLKEPSGKGWRKSELSQRTDKRISFGGISHDGTKAYVLTDMDAKTVGLYEYDLINETRKKVYESPLVDLAGLVSAYDRSIIGFEVQPNYNEIHFLDKDHKETKALAALMQAFPGQDVRFTSYTDKADQAVVAVSSDINPGKFYLFDFNNNSVKHLLTAIPWLNPDNLAEMLPIKYTARDGVEIHGYLTLPKGKSKNLPLIVHPHGGPHGPRDEWRYDPDVQFMANRGYAVLQMNFRGSGGYGQEFQEMGYRKWGREMQDDVTDATLWAIETGIADPERICIYGGSYGGYAALMGVVREPDLYKCALGYVGVYDLKTMYEAGDTSTRTRSVKYLEHVLGTDDAELAANSPAQNVEKIKAALFIAHGEEDVRVPMEQYEVLVENLDKHGIPYESMVKDEGHGYQKYKNRLAFYKAMEAFFAKHLK